MENAGIPKDMAEALSKFDQSAEQNVASFLNRFENPQAPGKNFH